MVAVQQTSLRQRVIRGSILSVAGHFVSQGIRLGGNLITTRLLLPEMFGVMAIANVLFIGIEMLSDLGIRQNIIQSRRGDDPTFLNTAWSLQIVRGLLLGLIVLALSALLYGLGWLGWLPKDSAYADQNLPWVIAALSLTPLLKGLESTNMATANRNLILGRLTLIEVLSQIAGPVVIIAWCFYFDRSVWALVAGWFTVSLTRMMLSHSYLPGIRNRLRWDRESLESLYHFGKWIFVSSILGFLLNNGDRLLFGFYLNSNDLGIYSIAFMMVSAVETLLRKLVANVSFPALSEIYRREPNGLVKYYYQFRRPIDLVSLFLVGVIFTGGREIIDIFYDDRYVSAGPMLEILGVSLFFIRFDVAGLCYLVLGKPKLLTIIIFARVVGLYLLVPLAFQFYDFSQAIWVIAINYTVGLPLLFYFNIKNGLFKLADEIKYLPALILGAVLGSTFSWIASELVL
ncbi:oligosaccharide flippase family protein [Methylomonas methanica]|uniref:Polysaccharide biosynthesis protein n=1 Tax=Methylomonas methanica (strain DSM 25384 / MC09) TaxID=857087 RepID=G0A248_METMM|nr:oligosaccharide flippase family protein [Methylomonas methanica]AEG02591.1 polysaccharide biosynthesis protein [Methylomonas methanica MC09]